MSESELNEIRSRLARATKGQWTFLREDVFCDEYSGYWIAECQTEEDAEFIANAKNDIEKLLEEIKRLKSLK